MTTTTTASAKPVNLLNVSWGCRRRFNNAPQTPSSSSSSPSPSRSSPSFNPAIARFLAVEVNQPKQTQTELPKPWNLRNRKHVSSKDDDFEYKCHEKQNDRVKFSVSLSKKEIEEDFLAMTGVRPARRPKKRAKAVQKQLNMISPGFWLTEITADMYKVNELHPPETGK